MSYINTLLASICYAFACYLFYKLCVNYRITYYRWLNIILFTILIESVLTILMYLIPPIDTILEPLKHTKDENAQVLYLLQFRIVGVGNARWFGVLESVTLGLCLTIFFFNQSKRENRLYYVISFIVISLISFLIARTTVMVIILALLYYLAYQYRKGHDSMIVVGVMGIPVFAIVFYIILARFADDATFTWAFQNLDISSGSIETDSGSLSQIIGWINKSTFNLEQLIIGDGYFVNPNPRNGDGLYYKGIDLGYFRSIYYVGLIGLIYYLKMHWDLLKIMLIRIRDINTKYFVFCTYIIFLVIYLKGSSFYVGTFLLLTLPLPHSYDTNKG